MLRAGLTGSRFSTHYTPQYSIKSSTRRLISPIVLPLSAIQNISSFCLHTSIQCRAIVNVLKGFVLNKRIHCMVRPITTLLHTFIMQQSESDWRANLLRNWNTIIGTLHTRMCLEKIYHDGTLLVGVHDSRWMQELFYLSQEVITTINTQLGHPHVTKIRFILSRMHHNPQQRIASKKYEKAAPAAAASARILTSREEQALQRIDDPQLQAILTQIMQKR